MIDRNFDEVELPTKQKDKAMGQVFRELDPENYDDMRSFLTDAKDIIRQYRVM